MQKAVLSIGLNDKDLHKQVITDENAHKEIVKAMAKVGIIGGTIKSGNIGIYNGELEKSCEVILYDTSKEKVLELCEELKSRLNQESIAVEFCENANIMFA